MVDVPLCNGSSLSFSIPSITSYHICVDISLSLASGLFAVEVTVFIIPAKHLEYNELEAEAFLVYSFPASVAMEGSIDPLSQLSPTPPLPPPLTHPSANPQNRFRFYLAFLSLLLSSSFLAFTTKLTYSSASL